METRLMRIGMIGAAHIGERTVSELIDQIGFDPVDAGTLAEGGRKHEFGSRVFVADLPTDELRARLAD